MGNAGLSRAKSSYDHGDGPPRRRALERDRVPRRESYRSEEGYAPRTAARVPASRQAAARPSASRTGSSRAGSSRGNSSEQRGRVRSAEEKRAALQKTRMQHQVRQQKAAQKSAKKPYVRPWERALAQRGPVSEQALLKRQRLFRDNILMVISLVLIMSALMFVAVQFLQIKAEYTATLATMASLESDLAELKEENDAYYNSLNTSVDLSGLKKRALTQLGMNPPEVDQKMSYTSDAGSGYLRQYQDAPD